MSNKKPFYITTTLPYVNSDPHIGFAMEIIRADVIARWKRAQGYDVFFNTGTDEHGAKIYQNATAQGVSVQTYVDGYAATFKELTKALNISDIHFIRTTDEKHVQAAVEMWKRCYDNGFIYKKTYQTKYCVGCELNKTDSELENGKCPIHPNREIELIDEENYFFKFSEFQKPLLDFYASHPDFVIPDFRFNEIKSFIERGLEDFSISRLKSKMSWGVPVPGDDDHVMYVWFDALTSYISTLDWPDEAGSFNYWKEGTPVQYCGKDNLRQQSAMWQAMLMASGLPNSRHIVINGFIISGGQKMSKSIGNVINPFDVIEMFKDVTDYPEDVLRFILLHEVPSFEDGDITIDSIKTAYTAYLANGIGNLTSRIMKMATSYGVSLTEEQKDEEFILNHHQLDLKGMVVELENFNTNLALKEIFLLMNNMDDMIQKQEPFKLIKTDEVLAKNIVNSLLSNLHYVGILLRPFLPQTSAKILECIRENKMPEKPLFARLP